MDKIIETFYGSVNGRREYAEFICQDCGKVKKIKIDYETLKTKNNKSKGHTR
jgi:Fe2+ or Zn2+ uptake regulation protein